MQTILNLIAEDIEAIKGEMLAMEAENPLYIFDEAYLDLSDRINILHDHQAMYEERIMEATD